MALRPHISSSSLPFGRCCHHPSLCHTAPMPTESKLHSFFTSSRNTLLRYKPRIKEQSRSPSTTYTKLSSSNEELANRSPSPSSISKRKLQWAGRSGPYLLSPVARFGCLGGVQLLAVNAEFSDALDASQDENIVCEHASGGSLPVLKLVFSLILP